MEDRDFLLFIKKVKDATSIDLSLYKETQMKRRLTTLREQCGYTTFLSFFNAMQKDKRLLHQFFDRMTINVSEFWRNPNRWEVLESKFLPHMLRQNTRVKCWSAACSTGEEPYTLAMILAELGGLSRTQIIATDIDDGALEKAKAAIYPERSIRDVPPACLEKYFKQEENIYLLTDQVKRGVQFRKGNLLEDSFESGFDLIICRNVIIYFTEEAKHILYQKFADALRPGGILFVGSTEQIFTPQKYGLEIVDTFFYRKEIRV